jgi:hypothetical protein
MVNKIYEDYPNMLTKQTRRPNPFSQDLKDGSHRNNIQTACNLLSIASEESEHC